MIAHVPLWREQWLRTRRRHFHSAVEKLCTFGGTALRFSLFSFSEVLGAVGTAPLLASRGHLGQVIWSRPLGDPYVGEALDRGVRCEACHQEEEEGIPR